MTSRAIDLCGDHTRGEDVTIRESDGAIIASNFARIARVHVLLTATGVDLGGSSHVSDSELELSGKGVGAGANAVVVGNRIVANNAFIANDTGGSCSGGGGQNQVSGFSFATSCKVVTCTTGSLELGTFCPPNTVSCQP